MLDEEKLSCPYCGSRISVLVDRSQEAASYIEDCEVCCRPILFNLDDATANLTAQREDD